MQESPILVALLREGALAAQMLGTGVTTLRKADNAHTGLLVSAFFSLSIGFERVGKLTVVLDHYISNNWTFPTDRQMRGLHHDLEALFNSVVEISKRRFDSSRRNPIPVDPIHQAILHTLSDFARITRYQNLDYLVQGRSASMKNPETEWVDSVGQLILKKHYKKRDKEADSHQAQAMDAVLRDIVAVMGIGPNGESVRSVSQAMLLGQETEVIQRHAQFYSLQLIRFFTETLMDLEGICHRARRADIPWFSELLAYFLNDDAYFKSRKTWLP